MRPEESAQHVVAALAGGEAVAEIVVVASDNPKVELGARMVAWETRHMGSLGDDEVDEMAAAAGRAALDERAASTREYPTRAGAVELFVEPHYPPDELVIVGAGHIARPLCRIGAMLGYRVVVLDDRPGFATRERFPEADQLVPADFSDPFRDIRLGRGTHLVLVTRGHKYDYEALREVLLKGTRLAYIGMVGSQRRVRAALEQLVQEGIPAERLAHIYAPIGLDIGAETPEEIAISIVSELVKLRRGGSGGSLRERARVVERWIDRDGPDAATLPAPDD